MVAARATGWYVHVHPSFLDPDGEGTASSRRESSLRPGGAPAAKTLEAREVILVRQAVAMHAPQPQARKNKRGNCSLLSELIGQTRVRECPS